MRQRRPASGPGSAEKWRIRPLPKPTAPAHPSPAFPSLPTPRCATFGSSLRSSAPHSLRLPGSGRSGHCGTVPASAPAPADDTPKLQYHRPRVGQLPDGQPAAPTENPRPGPPSVGRPASAHRTDTAETAHRSPPPTRSTISPARQAAVALVPVIRPGRKPTAPRQPPEMAAHAQPAPGSSGKQVVSAAAVSASRPTRRSG